MTTEFRRMQLRRGTAEQWAANDEVILAGELALQTGPGTGEAHVKVGDGITAYSALPFILEIDQAARDSIMATDGTVASIDSRVTALEASGGSIADLTAAVATNTTNIALRQTILPVGTAAGDALYWDGTAYAATALTPAAVLGTILYWSPLANAYVGVAGGAPGQALVLNPSGIPTWSTNPAAGVPEAPEDGFAYGRKDADWFALPAGGGLADAPVDGTIYGRQDADWVEVPGGFPDAPADGKTYGRLDNDWIELVAAYDLYFDFGADVIPANAERALVLVRDIVIPADLVGAQVSLDAGDGSAPVFTLYEGATARATLTLSSSSGTWAAVVGSVDIPIAAGTLVTLRAPGTVATAFTGLRASVAATRG